MRKLSIIIWSCCILTANQTIAAANEIIVIDRSNGCFHHENASQRFISDGESYRSGNLSVSTQKVAVVKDMILHSSTNQQILLTYLGITEEWFQQNRERMIRSVLSSHWNRKYSTFAELPSEVRNLIDYTGITNMITEGIAGENLEITTSVKFSVTFPEIPPLTVSTDAKRPGMLPLRVTHGTKKWDTYDPNISAVLQQFSSPDGPSHDLLNMQAIYGEIGWTPSMLTWSWRHELDEILSIDAYQSTPGYNDVKDIIEVTKADSGHINMEPLSLHLSINILEHEVIDEIWCWLHLNKNGEPKNTWIDILELHEAADNILKKHTWITRWKNDGENRHIELQISGDHAYTGDDVKRDARPKWKRAKLKGKPEFEIYLRDNGRVAGTIFAGTKADSVLLHRWKSNQRLKKSDSSLESTLAKLDKTPNPRDAWLDSADIPFGQKYYAVISPIGKIKTNVGK